MKKAGIDDVDFERALFNGEIDTAWELVSGYEFPHYTSYLLVYCAAMRQGADELAIKSFDAAKSLIQEDKELLGVFTKSPQNLLRGISDISRFPGEKRILACTLGFRYPQYQETFFAISEKFNYAPEYPQLILKE